MEDRLTDGHLGIGWVVRFLVWWGRAWVGTGLDAAGVDVELGARHVLLGIQCEAVVLEAGSLCADWCHAQVRQPVVVIQGERERDRDLPQKRSL
jgi:hypothetical protein